MVRIKKGAWSVEEDSKLSSYIHKYGCFNWRMLPKFAGLSRGGKSCKQRWMNYLRLNAKHGSFTKEEEDVITTVHKKLGNKWAKMAELLRERSGNEIKNYWHTHLKYRVRSTINGYTCADDSRGLLPTYDYGGKAPSHDDMVHGNNSSTTFSSTSVSNGYEQAPSYSKVDPRYHSNSGGFSDVTPSPAFDLDSVSPEGACSVKICCKRI